MIDPRTTRRGMTLLEVVAATALLAGLASIILGSISYMEAAAARERHRLQGMEVAHRLIAQYMDNPSALPDDSLPIQQAESYYRWSMIEEVMMKEEGSTKDTGRRRGRRREELSVNDALPAMLNRITVKVYLDDPSSPVLDTSSPVAELVRIFDPIEGRPQDVVLEQLLKLVQQAEYEEAVRARDAAQQGGTR